MTIGCLRTFYVNGTINYLFADDNNNPPIYFNTRPFGNTFRVQVLTNDATPVAWLDNTPTAVGPPATQPLPNGHYILILSFQEMDEEHD
jgi:hypothetical protein